jgi:2,5-furandicarboxylate decarboxylase 1
MGMDATRGSGPEFDKITIPAAAAAKAQAVLAELTCMIAKTTPVP